MDATCNHSWMANPGILDFDDPDPADFSCRKCRAEGEVCPDCGGNGNGPDAANLPASLDTAGKCPACAGWGVAAIDPDRPPTLATEDEPC